MHPKFWEILELSRDRALKTQMMFPSTYDSGGDHLNKICFEETLSYQICDVHDLNKQRVGPETRFVI